MKRWLILAGALLLGSYSFALVTPSKTDHIDYCTGANNSNCVFQIGATGNVTTAGTLTSQAGMSSLGSFTLTPLTTTQINALTPTTTGQFVLCGPGCGVSLCVSTGTAIASFASAVSSTTVCK